MHCPSVLPTPEEKAELTDLAFAALPPALDARQLSVASVEKCATEYDLDGIEGRTEILGFEGAFPHTVFEDTYREHASISCSIYREYEDGDRVSNRESCNVERNRYLAYAGTDQDVRLLGTVAAELVIAYLDHLVEYLDNLSASERFLAQLDFVSIARNRRGKRVIRAMGDNGGLPWQLEAEFSDSESKYFFGEIQE